MQGRLGLNTSQCLTEYEQLTGRIFGRSRTFHVRNRTWLGSKYDSEYLERIVDNLVNRYVHDFNGIVRRPTPFNLMRTSTKKYLQKTLRKRRDEEFLTQFPN